MKAALALAMLALPGCVVATVVETAVDVTATVVETTVDVGAAVVTAPIDLLAGDGDGEDAAE